MTRRKRDPKKEALVKEILDQYQPESEWEMLNTLKDIFGPMFEAMLQGEMNEHLGYESNTREEK
ncbi:MAG: IS256 family transposase, partial [Hungatella sp.]